MIGTVSQWLNGIPDSQQRKNLQIIFNALADRYGACMLGSAGIVINGAGNANARTGATPVYAVAGNNGNGLVNIPANTVLTVPVATTPQNTFNVCVFYISVAGTITGAWGTPAPTLAGVVWPNTPVGQAIIGGFTVNPTTAAFIGGTTLLDAANTNVVYFSPQGAFDPSVLLGAPV